MPAGAGVHHQLDPSYSMKIREKAPIYNYLKTVAGSILQTLIVFPILEKHILELNRILSLKIYDATGKLGHDETDFNNADASYFDSILASLPPSKVVSGASSFQLGNVFDCHNNKIVSY